MRKIVLFGAMGHIGAYTLDYLLQELPKEEYEIVAVGRRKTDFFSKMNIAYYQVDITCQEDFNKLPTEDVYAVIHLAGIMPATMKGYNPYPYIDVNIRGSLNVLEYCRKCSCKKIIVTHTESDLSGYWKPGALVDPDAPPLFDYSTNYAAYIISRRTVYEYCMNYYARYAITPYVIRCSTVYCYTESPYMYKYGKMIIPGYRQIYEKAMRGETIEVWGNPKVKTDIVYVKDFAQIVKQAIAKDNAPAGFYNIGTGMPVSLEDQIKIAVKVLGSEDKQSKIVFCPEKPDGRDFSMDISKTCRELCYKPVYDYEKYLVDYKLESEQNRFHGLFTEANNLNT